MAEYHVGCGAFGIYAGTLEPKNKSLWRNKSDVTEEAIEAVRDHMVMELLGGLIALKRHQVDGCGNSKMVERLNCA